MTMDHKKGHEWGPEIPIVPEDVTLGPREFHLDFLRVGAPGIPKRHGAWIPRDAEMVSTIGVLQTSIAIVPF